MKLKNSGKWSRLDNAAKIFPPSTSKRDTKVFRFSCTLKETIRSQLLAGALEKTLRAFPAYRCILKCGLFWYYFEESTLEPRVREEYKPPCSGLYNKNVKSLLFEVTYFGPRINLEIYHALTDGTGALQFLRVLTGHYLTAAHPDVFGDTPPLIDYDASSAERQKDSFQKYYSSRKNKKKSPRVRAYKVKGTRLPEQRMMVIQGTAPLDKLLELAHEHHTTLTVLCAALMVLAIQEEMSVRAMRRPVVLSVPVNLRKYFPSGSARNFFSVMRTSYSMEDGDGSLDSILNSMSEQFREGLTEDSLKASINQYTSLEKNVFARVVPLVLKDIAMRVAHDFATGEETASLSNIGSVEMPGELSPYIDSFSVYISANKPQICMCSFGSKLVFGFTAPFAETDIQQHFFRFLTQLGIDVEIAATGMEDA